MDSVQIANEFLEIKKELQRQRQLLRWSTSALIAVSSILLLGAANMKSFFQDVTVKRLALIDDRGVERVILTTDSRFVTIDGKQYSRKSPASGIIIQNQKGNETGGLAMLDDGTVSLTIDGYSKWGPNERASIYSLPDGSSGFLAKDPKGNVRAKIESNSSMISHFTMSGEDENAQIEGTVTPEGRSNWTQ